MNDSNWDYMLQLSVVTGEEPTATRFEQKSFIKNLDIALLELISLDLPRFNSGAVDRQSGRLRYDKAQIIYQPTGETVAITRHYEPHGKFFPAGPGLYLEIASAVSALEKTLDIDLIALKSTERLTSFLKLAHYQVLDRSPVLRGQSGLDIIMDQMIQRQINADKELLQLEIFYQQGPIIPGAHVSYNFDTVKEAMKALTDQDLSQIGPLLSGSVRVGNGIDRIKLSVMEEPLLTLERFPPFLSMPGDGGPGYYYVVPKIVDGGGIDTAIDLSMLPRYEKEDSYYFIATLGIETGKPEFHSSFQQFKEQFGLEPALQLKHPSIPRIMDGGKDSHPSL